MAPRDVSARRWTTENSIAWALILLMRFAADLHVLGAVVIAFRKEAKDCAPRTLRVRAVVICRAALIATPIAHIETSPGVRIDAIPPTEKIICVEKEVRSDAAGIELRKSTITPLRHIGRRVG